ncbi:MAG: translation initiation factor IF-2 [Rickettsiales bacterium]|nr:translation initiation factor IF-2 [Rickettsiales bacterium]
MSDSKDSDKKDAKKGSKPQTLSLTKTVEGGKVKQNFQRGRTKSVTVEVKKTRTFARQKTGGMVEVAKSDGKRGDGRYLTNDEREARLKALKEADSTELKSLPPRPKRKEDDKDAQAEEQVSAADEKKADKKDKAAEKDVVAAPMDDLAAKNLQAVKRGDVQKVDVSSAQINKKVKKPAADENKDRNKKIRLKDGDRRRSSGKLTVAQALGMQDERTRSLASIKRQRAKAKADTTPSSEQEKKIREVRIPEVITVQELANRMAERAVDVIKELMKLGTMATASQSIDADTAEIIVEEFGHKVKRVSDADVEDILVNAEDDPKDMKSRPPVVTVMGHVDHGKTSLLDAIRRTDVAAGEAGGITQHIGAYQIKMETGDKITFLDTPGHEAFTAMRARGAHVTDLVILVVAADDGIMPQTIEAINHAKSAEVPIIVAINKIDKPDADPEKVKNALMNFELIPEDFGGDVMTIPVSALEGTGLKELEEAVLLQSEVLELTANPDAAASGTVVEAQVDKGRGTVTDLLIQRGTLRIGDIVVAGRAYGRVRAIMDDKGRSLDVAVPSMPVEVLGLNDAPGAGDEFAVVESEKVARDITEYRIKKEKERQSVVSAKSLDQLFAESQGNEVKELPILIKSDVQGSSEAIVGSLARFDGDEVKVKVVHQAVGAINESDISLAQATGAIMVGFNVRAMPKAKQLAEQEGLQIRYYSVIYDLVDDVKKALSGMLTPDLRENLLGYAEIREVFNITKVGKVAGCMVTDGMIKRGAKVRLLRDNVVIHEGTLKTLKRFKDEVKEVKNNFECGMAFENYDDIRPGDQIEAFELQEVAREVQVNENKPEEKVESAAS